MTAVLNAAMIVLLVPLVVIRFLSWSEAVRSPRTDYLVLGGDARREVFAAQLKRAHPESLVLISGGSPDPCLYLLWKKSGASLSGVWSEHCSTNTFENFVYSVPLLERLGARKVAIVSNHPQLNRALPIAKILFASRGLAVTVSALPIYDSGDRKGAMERMALIVMALGWALVSQVYQPQCSQVVRLSDVDMDLWYHRGFDCQLQTGVPSHPPAVQP